MTATVLSRRALVSMDKSFPKRAERGVLAGELERTVSGVFARIVSGVLGGIGGCNGPTLLKGGEGVLGEAIAGCGIILGEGGAGERGE